jgi:hypothetical protein
MEGRDGMQGEGCASRVRACFLFWGLCVTYKEDLDEEESGADDDAEQEDHSLGRHDA